jgi:hypothetical protein
MKTMQTELKNITQCDLLESNEWQSTYYAYDNVKKVNCYITFSNVQSSWNYIITY